MARSRRFLLALIALLFATVPLTANAAANGGSPKPQDSPSKGQPTRPNMVVCVADDWSWPHASILGDPVVRTPNFDRVAREGVLFENAFVSTPSCTPSRLSILTGQHHWRLMEGDSLGGSLREEFPVYTELLAKQGYRIGRYGKGVWPSKHAFRHRDSFGEKFRSLDAFLKTRKSGEPFCYWHGGQDPHRPYEHGVGARSGVDPAKVRVPACLPDNEIVRNDLADYLWEVQRFDREIGRILATLKAEGELENTIVVVSSDNGMPFPRCKATLYDLGVRAPLAIRWGSQVAGGRRVADFVSLCDLAPTILEAAGLEVPNDMTGRSLMPQLQTKRSGQIDPERTFAADGDGKARLPISLPRDPHQRLPLHSQLPPRSMALGRTGGARIRDTILRRRLGRPNAAPSRLMWTPRPPNSFSGCIAKTNQHDLSLNWPSRARRTKNSTISAKIPISCETWRANPTTPTPRDNCAANFKSLRS